MVASRGLVLRGFLLSVAAAQMLCGAALAVELGPGDLLVATRSPAGVTHLRSGILLQTLVASGGNLSLPSGLALEATGDLLVTDLLGNAVIRIDPATGGQMVVSSGGNLVGPVAVAVEANGDILVADANFLSFSGSIVRVDPNSGAQTVLSTLAVSMRPGGIAVEASGSILVTSDLAGVLLRIDPGTGVQSTLSSGLNLQAPVGVAVAQTGEIAVADASGSIVEVDPLSGAQTLLVSGLDAPFGIAFADDGALLVTDRILKAILRIDPVTHAAVPLAGLSGEPFFLAVAPGTPPPAPIPMLPGWSWLALAGLLGAAVFWHRHGRPRGLPI